MTIHQAMTDLIRAHYRLMFFVDGLARLQVEAPVNPVNEETPTFVRFISDMPHTLGVMTERVDKTVDSLIALIHGDYIP